MHPSRIRRLGRWWAPGDVIIVLAVVVLSAFLIFTSVAGAGEGSGSKVRISVNGREHKVLPLEGDKTLGVEGFEGESLMEINGGKVRMIDSACPDKLCVRTHWISRPGESIICLPNRVVIEIKDGSGGPDAINY
ncbi:MAG: hypothetical protein A2V52_00820 [Actinobacteria bacterium RBG_19FT_COMBO_54_7]|uniref:Uncharacterized protein n=1 Tax=Candidatus Solincola sediminis TaxID=1797199 RepID=A0A1F2WGX6_9ACTN|nr:MAG: hypothetical protein A2Y75_03040 [Candidatus Solincola sediminis]OFW60479.1 MAG: hypothetical protein A2W01_09580 [Candidatus Solincola sediminis]OFW68299.1 MAG: hypothetical protein A2V52_00820 [Actinobacteria bacterium RBG_19FT_COMBO_54_7]